MLCRMILISVTPCTGRFIRITNIVKRRGFAAKRAYGWRSGSQNSNSNRKHYANDVGMILGAKVCAVTIKILFN